MRPEETELASGNVMLRAAVVSTFKNVAVLTALIIKSVDTEVYGIELNKGVGEFKDEPEVTCTAVPELLVQYKSPDTL